VRDRLAKISSIADALETAGELNRIQRRLLRIEVADRSMQAVEMDRQVITAKAAVLEVLGLGPDAASLLLPSFPAATSPDVGDLTARLIESNTELAIHFAQYRIAEDSLRLEIRKQYPDIVIGSGYGTEFNDHRVMFGFSIPIPILNANRGGIAQATAAREVARANAETTFARLLLEWDVAHRTSELVQSQRSQYEEIVLPLLDGQASDIARIAELGELDLFVLLETVTRTLDAKRRLIQLHVDELDAATIIRQILGPDSIRHPVPVDEEQDPNHTTTQQTSDAIAGGTP
jgi:outer membrane protein TolC